MKNARRILFSFPVLFAFTVMAADWPQWRGPEFNGSSPEKNLPGHWSKTENIAWVADMPGPSAATPVVVGDRVFVSSTDSRTKAQLALCLDRQTGKVLWRNVVGAEYRQDRMSNSASPSPVADGNRVFFFYGRGDLAAFDHAGKELWSRNIARDYGDFAFLWMFSSSPLLHDGKLYLQVLQRDVPVQGRGAKESGIESYLLAMDPATGKTLWKHIRPADAVQESLESFATPVPFEFKGRKELLVIGGDCITGHDPATGRELWRWGTWNPEKIGHWRLVPSPVAGEGVILACAPKREPIYAVKAGGNGQLGNAGLAWTSDDRRVSSDVPTPAFSDGDFFVLGDGTKSLSRVTPGTGKPKWAVEVPAQKKIEASPTVADGKIYFMDFGGDVFVFEAAQGKQLAHIPMGEPGDNQIRSTISVARGQLFIRTNSKLYCVGAGKAVAAR